MSVLFFLAERKKLRDKSFQSVRSKLKTVPDGAMWYRRCSASSGLNTLTCSINIAWDTSVNLK